MNRKNSFLLKISLLSLITRHYLIVSSILIGFKLCYTGSVVILLTPTFGTKSNKLSCFFGFLRRLADGISSEIIIVVLVWLLGLIGKKDFFLS